MKLQLDSSDGRLGNLSISLGSVTLGILRNSKDLRPAGGRPVVETEFAGLPHEMVTVCHLDGQRLMMTHYCAMGNQPTLQFHPQRSSESELFFCFVGGSNMDPAKDVHIHSGRFGWKGDHTIESESVAYKDGRPDHTAKFSLKRLSE